MILPTRNSMIRFLSSIWQFVKRQKWKLLIATLILVPVGALTVYALSPKQPEYVTAVAERGDIEQTVEAVGTVISERDLELQFPTSGVVAQVLVKEGDIVTPGQKIATLRAGNLAADISSAAAQLASAEADLRARLEGARPEDIAITEAEVQNKRMSLDSARTALKTAEEQLRNSEDKLEVLEKEASIALQGQVSVSIGSLLQQLSAIEGSLAVAEGIWSNTDVLDAMIRSNPADYDDLKSAYFDIHVAVNNVRNSASVSSYSNALTSLDLGRNVLSEAATVMGRAQSIIAALPITSYYTTSERDTHSQQLSAERSSIQSALSSLENAGKNLRDSSASFDSRMASEESSLLNAKGTRDKAISDIATYEAALRIAEAQLQLKRAPIRSTDLAMAQASVASARASLQRAQANYANTVITAPIAGMITKVNVKPGEFTPVGAAITLLGNSPYRIEMYVSEIDVPKVLLTQSGSIELDAFRGTHFKLYVSEIDTASTDRDGVPKYRIRLDFRYPHAELKIGMTGDARIVTGTKHDVVTVPMRAVLENEEGESYVRIQDEDGTVREQTVQTGLEGEGGVVEVIGIKEGDTIIVLEKL